MTPRPLIALAILASLCFPACDSDSTQPKPLSAQGLSPVVDSFLIDGHATPAAVTRRPDAQGNKAKEQSPDQGIGLTWTMSPHELQVFRSTAVHFKITAPPKGHESATCSWNFGDGSPVVEGCEVSHTFHGGRADQVVTLTLTDGDWKWTSMKTVPLERLPVVDVGEKEAGGNTELPARPDAGETTFRFAIIADTAAQGGVPSSVQAGLDALTTKVKPHLLIHAGGLVTTDASEQEAQRVRSHLSQHFAGADIKVAWGLSPVDRKANARLDRPAIQMVDDRFFPERYSFTFKGAYFLVVSAGGTEGVSEAVITWMREELAKAGIYDTRYVISYLPLHKFTDGHVGSLDKRFRLYELFLRARVTAFFSAGYRVYFNGNYGALPIISVGALAGIGGTLSGSAFAQPNSLVVVDQIQGVKERVVALEGPQFNTVLDEELLPESVEVYTR